MILLGAALFLAAEIAAFVAVVTQIGVIWALLLLFGVSAIGPLVVRRVGVGVIAHTQQRLAEGEVPTREIMDGFVVLIGGAMIAIPGFVGDTVGLALMFNPLRSLVINTLGHRIARQVHRFPYRTSGVVDARSWEPGDATSRSVNPHPGPPHDD